MKKLITSVFALFILASLQSCGPTPEDAIKYNDSIIDQVNLVINNDKILESLSKEPADMKSASEDLLKQINSSIDIVKKGGGFDGKTDFMDMAVKYLTSYKGVVENEYKEMNAINSKASEDITEDDEAKYNKLQDESDKKMTAASEEFDKFQKGFAVKYKFEIEEKSK